MLSYRPLVLPVLLLTCMINTAKAQLSDTVAAEINPQIEDNRVQFTSVLRPLRQIAGAPPSFYTYFWEFGDGTYSFEKEPVHIYQDTGLYEARLYATNNYDDGKKPPTRPRPVRVKNRSMIAANKMPSFFIGDGALEIKSNQMPKPGEDMVLLIGYRNNNAAGMSGSIMLLYNEKQFSQNSFDVADVRNYHQEKNIGFDAMMAATIDPDMIETRTPGGSGFSTASVAEYAPSADRLQLMQQVKQEMGSFRQHNIWRIEQLKQGEEKFMFLTMNTLPEMIKDTNAVVTITGLFVPDDPSRDMEKFNLELQIVASHDPNRIMLKNKRLNYRFTGKNRNNNYTVQFQNTGKGPAKRVAITVTMPGLLNTSTIDVVGMKPACTWCDSAYSNQSCLDTVLTKDSIQFIFRNIYLPGMQQDGVSDPDSTKGYIKYRIRFGKQLKKLPFETRAAIVFDKNEPVYTNRSVGRFKKGLSPGIILGYSAAVGSIPGNIVPRRYVLGFSVSEYAAYKKYFQWELFLESTRSYERYMGRQFGRDTVLNGINYKVEFQDNYQYIKTTSVEAAPLLFRYNFSSFLATGIGGIVGCDISNTTTRYTRAQVNELNGQGFFTLEGETGKRTESFVNWRGAFIVEALAGRVRTGPVVGIRYLQYVKPAYQSLFVYASWKL